MEAGGACLPGRAARMRLDPFALPVRFPAKDAGADGQMRQVELDRDRVRMRRAVRGMRMKIRLSVDAFHRHHAWSTSAEGGDTASVVLDHRDPSLSVPVARRCRCRGCRLAMLEGVGPRARSCLAAARAGWRGQRSASRAPLAADGRRGGRPQRAAASSIRKAPPIDLSCAASPAVTSHCRVVHRDEREIIARN